MTTRDKAKGIDPNSDSRFRKKGFTGHTIGKHTTKPKYPAHYTNHQRMMIRKGLREERKEQERVERSSQTTD